MDLELFLDLAMKGLLRGLARIDLAAWEFPKTSAGVMRGSSHDENFFIRNENRANNIDGPTSTVRQRTSSQHFAPKRS